MKTNKVLAVDNSDADAAPENSIAELLSPVTKDGQCKWELYSANLLLPMSDISQQGATNGQMSIDAGKQ